VCANIASARERSNVTGFELREEIEQGGKKYFLQTSLLPQKGLIQSSFFKGGTVFDTVQQSVDGESSPEELRKVTKQVHLENKDKFLLVLGCVERVRPVEDPKPHLKVAQALFRRHLYEEAILEAQKAIQKGSGESIPYLVIGESYYEMGDYRRAHEAIRLGTEINPEYPDIHNLLGKVHLGQKKCKSAIDSFSRAIELNPYYGEAYLNLARAYLLNTIVKEDYELSRNLDEVFPANVERAAQLDPYLFADRIEESRRFFREKDYPAAYAALEEVKGRARRGGLNEIIIDLYLMLIAQADELNEEEIERCLDRVREIVDQNPTYADGHNSLGILYTAKCKVYMDMASKAFRKALEINASYHKAQKNLRLSENDRQGIFILLKALLD
jgi:tetratricopeptide (TPR) repeat protein